MKQRVFIVTELLSNAIDLYTMIRKEGKNFSWERRMRIALNTISALRFLHTKKIVYLKLKTKNILVPVTQNPAPHTMSPHNALHTKHKSTTQHNTVLHNSDTKDVYSRPTLYGRWMTGTGR